MYELKDYLLLRGDLAFKQFPVNEIDEMVFASMGKVDYKGILDSKKEALFSECFKSFVSKHDIGIDEQMGLLESKILIRTLDLVSNCKRYEKIKISNYVNIINPMETEQMCALTVHGPDGKLYVSFRGTDDTIIAWKENCELAIQDKVPAQRDAVLYLETIAKKYRGPLVILGHSKGGNLAVFAAANVSTKIQRRIEKVLSYDGPGFMPSFLESQGYGNIKDKVLTLVPTSSIVGMLMKHAGKMDIIQCEKEGIYAHDIFYWNLDKDSFVRGKELSQKSKLFNEAVNKTINELDKTERQEFVDELFEALSSTGAENLLDFTENSLKQALVVANRFTKAKEIRQFILMLSQFLIKESLNSGLDEITKKIQNKLIDPVKEKIEAYM